MIAAVFRRDLRLAFSRGNGLGIAVMFFFTLIVLMPFSFAALPDILLHIGAGIIWIGALLSMLLGFDRLLLQDAEDGSLDIFLLHTHFFSLCLLLFAKAAAHWFGSVLPVILAAPILGMLMDMDLTTGLMLLTTLVIASPAITFIGLVGAALGVHLPRGNLLVAIVVLPLTIPVMIFAISSVDLAITNGGDFSTPLLLLGALSAFLTPLCSLASAAALKYL